MGDRRKWAGIVVPKAPTPGLSSRRPARAAGRAGITGRAAIFARVGQPAWVPWHKSSTKGPLNDGTWNGTLLRRRRLGKSGKRILAVGDRVQREVTGWVDITKMSFVKPIAVPFQNIGRWNLPEPPPVG